MTTWRMSFRAGNQGPEMWPKCLELGVAAITYRPLDRINLSKFDKGEPKDLWAKLTPTQKASLRRVAYEIKAGDVIFVKQGPKIICKGVVEGPYFFDSKYRIIDPHHVPWPHQVPVAWAANFIPIDILLGAEPLTVKKLTIFDLSLLKEITISEKKLIKKKEALEGKLYRSEIVFRSRNRALIHAIKANSNFRCEICGFRFEEVYGSIGKDYIIAHHIRTLSSGPHKTKVKEIALLCANCHAMAHIQYPPITIDNLRKSIKR
jgi:hypothetical protein